MSETTATPESIKHTVAADRRGDHQRWLFEVTQIPTAAGKEHRVIAWIDAWLGGHPKLSKHEDPHGNFEIRIANAPVSDHPIYFTAHLDHPGFVVEEIESETNLILSFRGGVMADYFPDAKVKIHHAETGFVMGTIISEIKKTNDDGKEESCKPFKRYACTLESPAAIEVGTLGTWDLPDAKIVDDEFGGIIHTNACDDLAAVAAGLSAIDELAQLRESGSDIGDVGDIRVLFTRGEEVGFIGAIGASRDGFMPKGARIIALENSRAFVDSPIHGGPIVRVGDRISIFSPELTGAVAKVAERIAGGASTPTASQKASEMPKWKWQRKLMAGGACEASVYCAYGYCSTCVCLPLGNYHNMAGLAEAQAGTHEGVPRVGCEFIGLDDYAGMVDLLIGCGIDLPSSPGFTQRIEKLWVDMKFVLE